MKRALVCLAAFGAMTSIALADPPAEPTDTSVPSIVVGVTSTTVIDDSLLDQIHGGDATNTFPPSDKTTGSGVKGNGNGALNNNEHVLKPNQIK